MKRLALLTVLLLAAASASAQKRMEACKNDYCPPATGGVDRDESIREEVERTGTWKKKPGDELMPLPDEDSESKPKPRRPDTDIERDTRKAVDKSGRKFADHQSEVNYMLCQRGNGAACKYIRYSADDPGPQPKTATKKGGGRSGGSSGGGGGGGGGGSSGGGGYASGGGSSGGDGGGDDGGSGGSGAGSGGGEGGGDGEGGDKPGSGGVVSKQADGLGSAGGGGKVGGGAEGAISRGAATADQLKAERKDTLADPKGGGPGAAGQKALAPDRDKDGASLTASAGGPGGGVPGGMDLAAAAASGFSASFNQAGLKMGSGPSSGQVLRADGSPASSEDVARLRAQISSDPAALMKRPDFFNVISRESFSKLKTDFKEKPEERDGAFKHVGLTEADRDFVRTETCNAKLEKECNKTAKEPYKKGEYVSPEDLKAIDEALNAEDEKDTPTDSPEETGAPGPERRVMDKSSARSIAARLNSLIGGAVSRLTGGGGEAGAVSAARAGGAEGLEEDEEPAGGGLVATRRGTPRLHGLSAAGGASSPSRRGAAPKRPLFRWWQAGVGAALVGGWLYARRRRRSFMER